MSGVFQRGLGRFVDHPWIVGLAIALITTSASVGHFDPELIARWMQPPPTEQNASQNQEPRPSRALPKVQAQQIGGWHVVLLVQSENLFTPESANSIRHVVDRLRELPQISQLEWIEDAVPLNIFGLREPVLPKSSASQRRFDTARVKAVENPMIGGFMLSSDAKTTMISMNLDWFWVRSDADCGSGIREVAEQAAAEIEGNDLTFQVTGRIPIEIALRARNRSNELKYQIIANLFTLIMAAILFRGIIAVIVVALAPGFGVYWTLGLLHYFDIDDNPFNHVILPILISLVGFTDGVHMMVQIRANRAAGHPPRQATRIALEEVGLACALTSLTTAIGFGSLSLAHHEVVQEFGWCCVIGVIVTFVAVVTIIPLLCLSPLGNSVHSGHSRGLIDRNFGRAVFVVDGVLQRYRIVSVLGLFGLAAVIGVAGMLRPDERRTSALPATGEELVALRTMDVALGGLEMAEVQVNWNDKIDDDSAEILEVMQAVDKALKAEPLIGHPISLATLVGALPGEGTAAERVSMIELLPPPLKRAFYTPEHKNTKAIFRVQDLGIAKYGPVFTRMKSELKKIEAAHPNFSVYLAGGAIWRWENLFQIVKDLALSLGTAIVIIFAVLTLVYRSLRIGLISIVPNIFPLAATGAVLVLFGHNLEMVSVCAFTVCLGIAVDDTIHFLTRYIAERKKTDDTREAIRRSFVAVGTALIMTTIVLVAGFATALTSDTRDHQVFAWMAILTISSALFADLILLPALLMYFDEKQTTENSSD